MSKSVTSASASHHPARRLLRPLIPLALLPAALLAGLPTTASADDPPPADPPPLGGDVPIIETTVDLNLDGSWDFFEHHIAPIDDPEALGQINVLGSETGPLLFSLQSDTPADLFGVSAASAGDWDDDGTQDIAICAPLRITPQTPTTEDPTPAPCEGAVVIYSGETGAALTTLTIPPTETYALAAVPKEGDIPLGSADLLIASAFQDTRGHFYIRRRVYEASTNELDWEQPLDELQPVLLAGDLNYDGVVSTPDIELLLQRIGATDAGASYGDMNLDGVITTADIVDHLNTFGGLDSADWPPVGALTPVAEADLLSILHGQMTQLAGYNIPGRTIPSPWPCDQIGPYHCNYGPTFPPGQEAPGDPTADDGGSGGQNGGGDPPDGDDPDDDPPGGGPEEDPCDVTIVGLPANGYLSLDRVPTESDPYTLTLVAIGTPEGENPTYIWSVNAYEFSADGPTCEIELTDLGTLTVIVSYSVTTPDGVCTVSTSQTVKPVFVLLRADYDRDGELSDEDDDLRDDLENPSDRVGVVTMTNDQDADGDGVPNFADGLVTSDSDDEDYDGDRIGREHFVRLELSLQDIPDLADKQLIFTYAGSDPAQIEEETDSQTGQVTYTPAPGGLRIWTNHFFDDTETDRAPEDLAAGGHYISPDEPYTPAQLGLDPTSGGSVLLWAEPIAPSSTSADLLVNVSVTDIECSDTISFTLFGIGFDRASDSAGLTPIDTPSISFPTPVIQSPTIEMSDPYFDAQRQMILADLTIAGTIDDRVAQLIDNATIPEIEIQLNGEPLRIGGIEPPGPTTVAADVSNGAPNSSSILEPFPTAISFSTVVTGVEVQPGVNTIQLYAENAYGLTGFASRSIQVTLERKDVTLEIASGGTGYEGLSDTITATLRIGDDAPIIEFLEADPEAPHIYRGGPADQFIIELPEPTGGVTLLSLEEEGGDVEMLNPFAIDDFPVKVWHPELPGAVGVRDIVIVETSNDSRIFEGEAFHEDNYLHDEIQPIAPDDLSLVTASEGGDFYPFLMRIDGPPELTDILSQIQLGETEYQAVEHDGMLRLAQLDAEAPRAFLVVPIIPLEFDFPDQPELSEDFPNNPTDWSEAAAGFCRGLGDSVVGIWDGVVEIHSLAVDGTAYVITFDYRVRNGDAEGAIADLKHDYRMAKEKAEAIADVLEQIAVYTSGMYFAAATGNQALMNKYGSEMALFAEYAAEIIELAYLEWKAEATDYEVGRAFGRIYGEIVLAVASVGVGYISKGATLVSVLQKLRVAPWMQRYPLTLAKIDSLIIRAQGMTTTIMCFVAGTPVHTADGLRPIESIQAGDLVLSRDERTGETGFKPVVETFVTHPEALYRITINNGADSETLICTGEHPFYSATAEQFVPAAELSVGETLVLQSAEPTAHITDIQVERGPPEGDGRYTTYNFEVADWNTYFVGDSGVWVHNRADDACEQIFSIYEKIKDRENLEGKPWTAWRKTLEKFDARRVKIKSIALFGALTRVQRDLYAKAANTADNVTAIELVRFSRLKTAMTSRLQDNYLEVHHVFPQRYAKVLYKRLYDTNEDPPTAWLNSMPGLVMPRTRHNGRITIPGEATIESLIRNQFADLTESQIRTLPQDQFLLRLSGAYDEMNAIYGDVDGIDYNQVWSLGERWFQNVSAP